MSWAVLRPQIKTLIQSVTGIHTIEDYPKLQFDGYPSGYIVPETKESAYETTSENIRTYAFIVRLFYETKKLGIQTALQRLESIVDSVIDAIDEEDLKDSTTRTIGINLPLGSTYINIFATPSIWAQVEDEQLIMAEITVRVRVSRDIS